MVDPLASKIRSARERSGLTREQLAAKLGVSLATVVRLETGRTTRVTTDRLLAVAKATKQPLSFFLGKVAA